MIKSPDRNIRKSLACQCLSFKTLKYVEINLPKQLVGGDLDVQLSVFLCLHLAGALEPKKSW